MNDDSLFELAMALIKVGKSVRTQRLGLGFGCKPDRLYVEVRPMVGEDSRPVHVWSSGNVQLYERLAHIEDMIHKGN